MKPILWFALAATLMTAPPTYAQSAGDSSQKSRFYEMGPHEIPGTVRRPVALAVEAHTRPKWARLFALKKSMRPALHATAAESTLK